MINNVPAIIDVNLKSMDVMDLYQISLTADRLSY